MNNEISSCDNTIDPRDVKARIEELETELEDLQEAVNVADNAEDTEQASNDLQEWIDDNQEELDALKELAEQIENYSIDTLINESYFEEYAEELAYDIGAIDRNATWPLNCINWEEAAEELKSDHTVIEFQGTTFYAR